MSGRGRGAAPQSFAPFSLVSFRSTSQPPEGLWRPQEALPGPGRPFLFARPAAQRPVAGPRSP